MNWNSPEERQAFKKTMKILGKQKLGTTQLAARLTRIDEYGEAAYSGEETARKFVKKMVYSDNIPIDRVTDSNLVYRTDLTMVKH